MPKKIKIFKGQLFDEIRWLFVVLRKIREANSKFRILEDLCNLVASVCAKFEGCAAKTVGEVGFLRVTVFKKAL